MILNDMHGLKHRRRALSKLIKYREVARCTVVRRFLETEAHQMQYWRAVYVSTSNWLHTVTDTPVIIAINCGFVATGYLSQHVQDYERSVFLFSITKDD